MNIPVWLPWILVWVVLVGFFWALVRGGSKGGGE